MNQLIVLSLCLLTACAPAAIGGGTAMVGGALVKEKGLTGAMSDVKISTSIKTGLYRKDPELYNAISVTVQDAQVLLTGSVPSHESHLEAVKIAWEPRGVLRVLDNITVSEDSGWGSYPKDVWITTKIKSALLFDADIQSLNYTIKTVNGQVHILGIAQDDEELRKVTEHARHVSGVEKVISYARLKTE